MANKCNTVFVEPAIAKSSAIAFSKALAVIISLGLICFLTRFIIALPAWLANCFLAPYPMGIVPLPGKAIPKASDRQFIEFAVNKPEQLPAVGHAQFSNSVNSSSLIFF